MKSPRLQIYRDARKWWRFRIRAANGRVIATLSEGYLRKRALSRAIELTRAALNAAADIDIKVGDIIAGPRKGQTARVIAVHPKPKRKVFRARTRNPKGLKGGGRR